MLNFSRVCAFEYDRRDGTKTIVWCRDSKRGVKCQVSTQHTTGVPFKYGRYGTKTASTVVIGDAESVGAQVYRLLFRIPPFIVTLSFTSYRQGKNLPSHTYSNGLSDPIVGRKMRNE